MGAPLIVTNTQMVHAIKASHGLVYRAAKLLGISPRTIQKRAKKYPRIKRAIRQCRGLVVDEAESVLFKAMMAGNLKTAEFLARTLGKSRGYTEKRETESNSQSTVTQQTTSIDLSRLPPELLVQIYNALQLEKPESDRLLLPPPHAVRDGETGEIDELVG